LPLDPVPKTACPEFIAGSHSSGTLYYPRLFINHQNYADGAAGFETIPDIDANRDAYDILSWDLELGDCIVFHMRTIHGAPPTTGIKTRRRGFSTRWLGDDARFALRPWRTSPPYREVELKPGDKMEHASFPLVWQG
jgi:ectoine hydroxylase-related dioxygenase (phytanoyl-CoA dioxygenase family)